MNDAARPSRRTVLLAALAVPLAACRPKHRHEVARVPAASPDAQALSDALAAERSLLADYDSAVATAASAGGMPYALFRATHAAHVQALESVLSASPAAPTSSRPTRLAPSALAPSAAALRAREAATGRVLTEAAVAARQGATAALLASIAASHLAQSHMRFHHGGEPH